MIVTILEGHITSERWNSFEEAYRTNIKKIPIEQRENILIQDVKDCTLWRIISIWRSKQDYEKMKDDTLYTTMADVYRKVGVEPTHRVFNVIAQHTHI